MMWTGLVPMTPRISSPPRVRNAHPLRDERLRVEASQGLQAQEAVVVDVTHDEADLVEVTGEHHLARALTRPVANGDDVAETVGLHPVDVRRHLTAVDVSDSVFEARRSARFTKLT